MSWTKSDYENHFSQNIATLKANGRYRHFAPLERLCGTFPRAIMHKDGMTKEVTVWCSNDYLGLGQHPAIIAAMKDALDQWGTGSGGTRNIGGTTQIQIRLEAALAAWHNKAAALVFPSAYTANLAALSTLIRHLPDCIVVSDEKNHASMIMGITRHKPEKHIFRHNDVADLERILSALPAHRPVIVAIESVYSMEGSIAPLRAIARLARRYGALTYLDEVHGVGLYGDTGAGVAERDGTADDYDIINGTFGKAFGCAGGYIAGSATLIDMIRSHAPDFIFTTSTPPAQAAGVLAALEIIKNGKGLREQQQKHVARLRQGLTAAGLPILPSDSHIVPLIVGGAQCCKGVADWLFTNAAIYVQPINFPTVPVGQERLRLTPTPLHTDAMIDTLIDALATLWDQHQLPRQVAA